MNQVVPVAIGAMSTTRYLSPEERARLVAALPSPRDRLFAILAANTGFRVSELLSFRWHQLMQGGVPVEFVEVARKDLKGGRSRRARRIRSRRVPLNAAAALAVKEYAFALTGGGQPNPNQWVFASRKRFPGVVSRRHMRDIIHDAARRAALVGSIAPHSLRRAFAEDSYRASGCDIGYEYHPNYCADDRQQPDRSRRR